MLTIHERDCLAAELRARVRRMLAREEGTDAPFVSVVLALTIIADCLVEIDERQREGNP